MNKERMLAPIVLFTYNRLANLEETINYLKKNFLASYSELFIFSDGPKNKEDFVLVNQVRDYLYKVDGFKNIEIVISDTNKGLGKSVIDGVSKIVDIYGKVIVVEDDLQTTTDFLEFMNDALEYYQDDNRIYSIGGYIPPIYLHEYSDDDIVFIPRICSWGWAIWKDRWEKNDWNISDYNDFISNKSKIQDFSRAGVDMIDMLINQVEGYPSAWAIRCDYNRYKQNDSMTVYPCSSKVLNKGADGKGVNTPKTDKYDIQLKSVKTKLRDFRGESINITKEFHKFYTRSYKSFFVIYLRRVGLLKLLKRLSK